MSELKNTLLFIPDISGFTRFVNSIEIDHSRHIISELLEIIINSDISWMTISEIEGDLTVVKAEVDFKIKSFLGRLGKSMVRKILQKQTIDGLLKLKQASEEDEV